MHFLITVFEKDVLFIDSTRLKNWEDNSPIFSRYLGTFVILFIAFDFPQINNLVLLQIVAKKLEKKDIYHGANRGYL